MRTLHGSIRCLNAAAQFLIDYVLSVVYVNQ
jgi:hypothetical protein